MSSAKKRGLLALVAAARVTNVGVFHGPVTKSMDDGCTIKPFEAESIHFEWPGTLTGVLPYQAVGYGQILPASYAAAMKACRVIVKKGSPGVAQALAALVNPLDIGVIR
ncbi:hypothetical protein DFH28DRAFT_1126415 [Melampsora americana]|nr:hypothetical protein DFH28DRAFT_1126415 [Melampsora americana]